MPIPEFDDPNFHSESKPSVVAGGAGDQIRSCFSLQSARYRTGVRGVFFRSVPKFRAKAHPPNGEVQGLGSGVKRYLYFP